MATKRARRGRGEGSVHQRENGTWAAQLSLGFGENGRRRRVTVSGDTKKEVLNKLAEKRREAAAGTIVATTAKLDEFLDGWLDDVKRTRKPATHCLYERSVRKHVTPYLGHLKLADLKPRHIRQWHAKLDEAKVGRQAQRAAHGALRTALFQAVDDELLPSHPMGRVRAPKATPKEIRPLTEDQVRKLLKTTKGHRVHALFVLAVTTGMRVGELLALHWEDVDEGTLTVRFNLSDVRGVVRLETPKTTRSRRTVKLTPAAVEALGDRRRIAMREGQAGHDLVFPTPRGLLPRKTEFDRYVWKPLRDAAGIPPIRFHDLRHSAASLMLKAGVPVKVVSEMLGHANVTITLGTYAHVMEGMQDAAADAMQAIVAG